MGMPSGFPESSDFDPNKVEEVKTSWEFKRDPGLGGKNEGQDFLVPDGSVLVDFETHERSRHNTKGNPDIRLVFNEVGMFRIPKGVHNGIRLTPGEIAGAGASYTGDIVMKTVSEPDWYAVVARPHE